MHHSGIPTLKKNVQLIINTIMILTKVTDQCKTSTSAHWISEHQHKRNFQISDWPHVVPAVAVLLCCPPPFHMSDMLHRPLPQKSGMQHQFQYLCFLQLHPQHKYHNSPSLSGLQTGVPFLVRQRSFIPHFQAGHPVRTCAIIQGGWLPFIKASQGQTHIAYE